MSVGANPQHTSLLPQGANTEAGTYLSPGPCFPSTPKDEELVGRLAGSEIPKGMGG